MVKRLIYLIIVWLLLQPSLALARESVNYWYVKDFKTIIQLNTDSSATITENINADCGLALGKHGIFRVIPTKIGQGDQAINTPVELISITDQDGKSYKYQTIEDPINQTITWKIGDSQKQVRGENYYQIKYRVKNVILQQDNFDEFYWNILGAFWDMDIDNFSAWIMLPPEIKANSVVIDYYTGQVGQKNKDLASYRWLDNVLVFESKKVIPKNNGITVSLSLPKNIFIPDKSIEATTAEKNIFKHLVIFSFTRSFLLSFLTLVASLIIWFKYGRNSKETRPIIAEYGPPDNLDPLSLGMLWSGRSFGNNFITALIISLAVKGVIKIEEKDNDHIFYKLNNIEAENSLSNSEKLLFRELFKDGEIVTKSKLSSSFYLKVFRFHGRVVDELRERGYFEEATFKWRKILLIAAVISMFFSPFSAIIFSFFYLITSNKKTPMGMEVLLKIKGLKLYMETAEKHRQKFYEQEHIFDKLLPYAIVFGLTKLWVKKMADIYGPEKIETIVSGWYLGGNFHISNIDDFAANFDSSISQISQSIHSSTYSSNWSGGGSHGSGSSGGGGGGGGGGGW